MTNSPVVEKLVAERLPLAGRHIIEASAGTGKTFNISRIYLRLLLEKQLKVQSILVVTFTRAATEELRGRIAKDLRATLQHWGNNADSFHIHLESVIDKQKAEILLNEALLDIDEAAIFTIHGFCSRVLSQQAFSSGLPFQLTMEADTADLQLDAVRDAYRRWAKQEDAYALIAREWSTPEQFLKQFKSLLTSNSQVACLTPSQLKARFLDAKKQALSHFKPNIEEYKDGIINKHKQRDARMEDLETMLAWLGDDAVSDVPKALSNSVNSGRFPKALKAGFNEMTAELKALKDSAKNIESQFEKHRSFSLAIQSLPSILEDLNQAKERQGLLDFDDLISKLKEALQAASGEQLKQALIDRYPVALVDEFQDTDPSQYAIFNNIYQETKNTALFMIGDPKQAIYSFRGGDVFAYLSARKQAERQWHMDTNWRSSQAMVTGYNRLFYGEPLTDDSSEIPNQNVFGFNIDYAPVKASGTVKDELSDTQYQALQFVHFTKDDPSKEGFKNMACWCAEEIDRLLTSKTEIGEVPLQEKDIAILVRNAGEAKAIRLALQAKGYNAVYSSDRENVFQTRASDELYCALNGILNVEDARKMTAALSSQLIGLDAAGLYALTEDENSWEGWRENLAELRSCWFKKGFMAMAMQLLHDYMKPQQQDRERSLTNFLHLIELLQQATTRHQQPLELMAWFETERSAGGGQQTYELRLESDANLLRIITQHGSKGLEYPIVFVPFSSYAGRPKSKPMISYHHRETLETIQQLLPGEQAKELAKEESHAEDVRLLYVAITRAVYRCYLCTAPFKNTEQSPLGLTLKLTSGEELQPTLRALHGELPSSIGYLEVAALEEISNVGTIAEIQDLPTSHQVAQVAQSRQFSGNIDRDWWMSSFSLLSQHARITGMSQPDRDQDQLPAEISESALTLQVDDLFLASQLRFNLKKGADTGNFLHSIFEKLDFTSPDWELATQRPLLGYNYIETDQQPLLVDWLTDCLNAELIDDSDDALTLSILPFYKTLRESEFYFSIEQADMAALSTILREFRRQQSTRPADFWLPPFKSLQGMMHGFIDLIFEWQGRYFIADYKSTWLGNQFQDYAPDKLQINIEAHFYDLQYLIYSVALHRYLKNSLPDYSPDVHFGGVFYLYLRGMKPNSEGDLQGDKQTGVFYTAISPQQLSALDALFSDRGEK